jgi:aryl-alcohol dehydrogenase-like predicted oxidoreductase
VSAGCRKFDTSVCFSQWRTEAALGEVAERHTKLIVKISWKESLNVERVARLFYRLLFNTMETVSTKEI